MTVTTESDRVLDSNMDSLTSLSIFCCIWSVASSFQWTSDLQSRSVKAVCVGDDLHLLWNYTLDAGEEVSSTRWFFYGSWKELVDEELVGTLIHGQFVPMPDFIQRAQFLPPAGVTVRDVTLHYMGNYSVEISGHRGTTPTLIAHRLYRWKFGEPPAADYGELRARQDQLAVFDTATDQWVLQLTCGHFTHLGQPPVSVMWTNPRGETMPSTSFRFGNSQLNLADPIQGGNYTCSIVPQSPATSCLPVTSRLLQSSSVYVDSAEATKTLQAAKQANSQNPGTAQQTLLGQISSLLKGTRDTNLTFLVHELQELHLELLTLVDGLQHKMAYQTETVIVLEESTSNKSSQLASLQNSTANLTQQLNTLHSIEQGLKDNIWAAETKPCFRGVDRTGPCAPGNHTVKDQLQRLPNNTQFSLCDAFNGEWYRFQLNGKNAIIPNYSVKQEHCGTLFPIWVDLRNQSLPGLGKELSAVACSGYPCDRGDPVTIRNCGDYLVYRLNTYITPSIVPCYTAHCAIEQPDSLLG